mmetsp:Transcript_5183/g.6686  ORF Transcript_5183/g.6686 Transcript_5183/m.6686 type:complete len:82 (+) Transcript_5183:344-589(+)
MPTSRQSKVLFEGGWTDHQSKLEMPTVIMICASIHSWRSWQTLPAFQTDNILLKRAMDIQNKIIEWKRFIDREIQAVYFEL